jgi:anthranilate phosphoribosyltransferase
MTTLSNEHSFAQYIRILGKGKTGSRSLSQDEAYTAFSAILNDEAEDIQIGAFLMLLRVKEESPEEIAGFVRACKDFINAPKNIAIDIDWSSYAGKRKHLPWFIASLLILAQHGYRVFIHGAKGHTVGRLYSEDVFQQLGLPISHNWSEAAQQLNEFNLSFMPIHNLCTPLERLINLRGQLGLRSPVHTLCRLINPLNAPYSFQSIFHPAYAGTHQQAASLLKQKNMAVFKGEGGEIERKSNATCLVKSIINDTQCEEKWPRLLDEKEPIHETLDLNHFTAIWQGKINDSYAEQAITGTLAIVLKSIQHLNSMDAAQQEANRLFSLRNKNTFL